MEFVVPDYYAKYPKPCMGGWGRKVLLIKPNGDVLAVPRRERAARNDV